MNQTDDDHDDDDEGFALWGHFYSHLVQLNFIFLLRFDRLDTVFVLLLISPVFRS